MPLDTTLEAEAVQLRALSRLRGEDRLQATLEHSDLVSRIHDAGVDARRLAVEMGGCSDLSL